MSEVGDLDNGNSRVGEAIDDGHLDAGFDPSKALEAVSRRDIHDGDCFRKTEHKGPRFRPSGRLTAARSDRRLLHQAKPNGVRQMQRALSNLIKTDMHP
jgi:hypothetical protein